MSYLERTLDNLKRYKSGLEKSLIPTDDASPLYDLLLNIRNDVDFNNDTILQSLEELFSFIYCVYVPYLQANQYIIRNRLMVDKSKELTCHDMKHYTFNEIYDQLKLFSDDAAEELLRRANCTTKVFDELISCYRKDDADGFCSCCRENECDMSDLEVSILYSSWLTFKQDVGAFSSGRISTEEVVEACQYSLDTDIKRIFGIEAQGTMKESLKFAKDVSEIMDRVSDVPYEQAQKEIDLVMKEMRSLQNMIATDLSAKFTGDFFIEVEKEVIKRFICTTDAARFISLDV